MPAATDVDVMAIYRAEIGGMPRLSAEDEVALGVAIQAGRQALQLLERETLTPAESDRLTALAAAGQAARERFVRANLRLVVSRAQRLAGFGLALADLVQEGNLALLRAVEGFDPAFGVRFSSYAVRWIDHALSQALAEQGGAVRVPPHARRALAAVRRGAIAEPAWVIVCQAEFVSLDQPLDKAGEVCWGDHVADVAAVEPLEAAAQGEREEAVHTLLAELTDEQARVIMLRYGLAEGSRPLSVRAIAQAMGLTRERVARLERQGLGELNRPARSATSTE